MQIHQMKGHQHARNGHAWNCLPSLGLARHGLALNVFARSSSLAKQDVPLTLMHLARYLLNVKMKGTLLLFVLIHPLLWSN